MTQITVTYMIDEQQQKQLEGLLPYWKSYTYGGERPFADWTIKQLFQAIMTAGCCRDIDSRIAFEQSRQEAIILSAGDSQ